MIRFQDNAAYDTDFQREVAVCCPRCQRRAYVFSDGNGWRAKSARFSCSACGYSANWIRQNYRGPSVGIAKRRCRHCGRWLERKYFGAPHAHEARLRCPGCNTEMREPISWSRRWPSNACDPYFGYPLWFVGAVKGNVFWAYNSAHLAFIKNYTQATVRVREPNRNSSLASRLPHFLLGHKNRAAVSKEIARLEAKGSS